jgi:hypothetical protein
MKKSMIILVRLFVLCTIFQSAFGENLPFVRKNPHTKLLGLLLVQTDRGSGIGGFFEWSINRSNRIGISPHFLAVRGQYEYPIYDPYTGYVYERSDKKRLTLLPIYLDYKRILFTDSIANNFRPFLNVAIGPTIGLDPPNIPEFFKRWKKVQAYYSYGWRVGGGIDFGYGIDGVVSVFIGYEGLKFAEVLDGSDDYSGIVIRIGLGKKY